MKSSVKIFSSEQILSIFILSHRDDLQCTSLCTCSLDGKVRSISY